MQSSPMRERGPDGTGFALYGDGARPGAVKMTLYALVAGDEWAALESELATNFRIACPVRQHGSRAVFTIAGNRPDDHVDNSQWEE